jgi:hypothetical protein
MTASWKVVRQQTAKTGPPSPRFSFPKAAIRDNRADLCTDVIEGTTNLIIAPNGTTTPGPGAALHCAGAARPWR